MRRVILLLALVLCASHCTVSASFWAGEEPCERCVRGAGLLGKALSGVSLNAMADFAQSEFCAVTADPESCRRATHLLLPAFAQWFLATGTPASLCSGSCAGRLLEGSPLHQQARFRSPPLHSNAACAMCSYVVNQIKATLNDTEVQKTIMKKAIEVCQQLPADLDKSCIDFVQTYEPLISQFIQNADADQLCMMLGACFEMSLARFPNPPVLPAHLAAALGKAEARLGGFENDACDICQMAVIEAHSLVTDPTVQADLVNYTHAICALFGGPFTQACDDEVDQYAPSAFDALEKFLGPELCSTLGVCPPSTIASRPEPATRSFVGSFLFRRAAGGASGQVRPLSSET